MCTQENLTRSTVLLNYPEDKFPLFNAFRCSFTISLVTIKPLLSIIKVGSIFRCGIRCCLIRGVELVIVLKTKLRVRSYLSFNDILISLILPTILSSIRFKIATGSTVSKLLRKFTFSSNIPSLTILYTNQPISQIYQPIKLKELGRLQS